MFLACTDQTHTTEKYSHYRYIIQLLYKPDHWADHNITYIIHNPKLLGHP